MDLIQSLRTLTTISQSKDYTHTSIFPKRGSYYLEPMALSKFMEIYCNAVSQDIEIGVGERIINACPIFTDIDLRSLPDQYDEPVPLYTADDLANVVKIYFKLLKKIIPDLDPHEYTCVALEKSPYMSEGIVKHGFHLHFPYICLSLNNHKNHIIPVVERKINDYFRGDVFDAGVIHTPWLLYGSKKDFNKEPYLVTKIYNVDMDIIQPEKAFESFSLVNAAGSPIKREHPIEYYYPIILSTNCQFRELKEIHIDVMDSSLVRQITEPAYHTDKEQYIILGDEQYGINLEKARQLISMLSERRASDYNDWMRVGWCLFNSCGPGEEVLELWIQFSKNTHDRNYNRQVCIDAWKRMNPGSLTIRTLYMMASTDSPEAYASFVYEERRNSIYASLSGAHFDMAMLLYEEYKDMYRCVNITKKLWYQFTGNVWESIEVGTDLRHSMSTSLLEKFKLARHREVAKKRANEDRVRELGIEDEKTESTIIDKQIKTIDTIITRLKTQGFKDSVMRECCEVFYDKYFEDRLDSNPYLFAFKNGVYDLKTHTFRCGLPSDCITLVSPIDYVETYDIYHPDVQQVLLFLEQIFPDRSLREYFVNVYSSIMVGGNKEKKFYIWTGDGNNGKSIMYDLFELVMGPYSQKPPVSLITGKRTQAAQADPILARCRGVRSWMFQESRQQDPINSGIVKELTGNDSFSARDLFQKGSEMKEIKPMFKSGLMCNELPTWFDADPAVWNRVRLFPFESEFVTEEDLPPTEDEQLAQKKFLIDFEFKDKLPRMAQPFAWYLLHELKRNGGNIGKEPFKVRAATTAYRTENNLIEQYVDENIESYPGGSLSLSELYQSFSDWYKLTGISRDAVMSRRQFKKKMTKYWGEPVQNRWRGWTFLQEDFEEPSRILEE